jgi:hypothetical protein
VLSSALCDPDMAGSGSSPRSLDVNDVMLCIPSHDIVPPHTSPRIDRFRRARDALYDSSPSHPSVLSLLGLCFEVLENNENLRKGSTWQDEEVFNP